MIAIVSGNSLGLNLSSLATLGQRGVFGNAAQGSSGEQAYVNIATGNLVLQDRDDKLVGHGADVLALRTYNSKGLLTDDNGDNWTVSRQAASLSGTLNTVGSSITRVDADGSASVYSWNAAKACYSSSDGAGAYDSFVGSAGQLVWTDGQTGVTERYDQASGRLLSKADTSNNTISYAYNAAGIITSITSASGEISYFDYVGTNLKQVRTVTAGGATLTRTAYAYDSSNRLIKVTVDLSPNDNSVADARTYSTSYTYDGTSKRVASVVQSDGNSLTITYIDLGGGDVRVASVKDGLNQLTNYSYNTVTRRTTVTDPLGLITLYDYDTARQLTAVTSPAVGGVAQSSSFVYSTTGDILRVVDGEGRAIDMQYDANGNQVLQRDAAGNTVTRSFDARNQVLTETAYLSPDPDGAGALLPGTPMVTRYVYDAGPKNLLRYVISAEGRITENRYDSWGQRVRTIQYGAALYNIAALAATAVPSEAVMTAWVGTQDKTHNTLTDLQLDARGQLQILTQYAVVDAAGNGVSDGSQSVTKYVYDQAGQLLQTISGTAGVSNFTYDGLGRVLTTQNALSQTTSTRYDDAGNKTTISYANGLSSTSSYDKAGRLISVQQSSVATGVLGSTLYTYDADNRLVMAQDPSGVRNWLLYDEAGRKVADIDGNGSLTEYVYNKNNQLTQTIAYATAVNTASLVTVAGVPIRPSLASVRPAQTTSDRKTWYAYDTANRLSKTVDAQGAVTATQYDGASCVVATVRYANLISTASLGSAPTALSIAPTLNATADRLSRNFYDADGLLRATLDAEGYLTELRYNSAAQLSSRIAYATATTAALRASGTLAQLLPATSAADMTTRLILNSKGQVAAEIDAEGYLTEKVYDANGNLTQSVRYATVVTATALLNFSSATLLATVRPAANAQDRSTAWRYDQLNRVTQLSDPEGTVTQYSYDSAGNLTQTVLAVGSTDTRTLNARYDVQGRLVAELSGVGSALLIGSLTQPQIDAIWSQYGLTHSYDAAARRTSTVDQIGNKTLFFYDVDGHLTHSVNALGEVSEDQYNTLGQLSASVVYGTRINPALLTGTNAGGLVNTTLTSAINAIKNTALDSVTRYTYNSSGTLASSADALSNLTSYSYNAFADTTALVQTIDVGRTLSQSNSVDRRGLRTGSVLDASGINAVTSAVYDAFGRVTSSVDANGNTRSQAYDRLGRVIKTTDPSSAVISASYDAFARVCTQTDALGNVTRYAYDKLARSVAVTTPEGITVTTQRNRLGQTQSITDGRGNVSSYSYDKNGNLTNSSNALTSTSASFDRANRLQLSTDARGIQVTLSYDAANRVLTRSVDPTGLNLVTRYGYDAKGQQISVTDANGTVTQLVFDLKGQLVRQVLDPTGLNLVTLYSYDARGKTLSVTNPVRAAAPTVPAQVDTLYSYDALGRRTKEQIDPSGLNLTRSYVYDKGGNLRSATDANGNLTRYVYDANDRLVFTLDALGNVQQNSYDALGRITRTKAYAIALTAARLSGLGATPNLAQVQTVVTADLSANSADVVQNRVYDKEGRLSATVNALGDVVKYSFDANGNVTERVAYANRVSMSGTGAWVAGSVPSPVLDDAHDQHLCTVYDQLNRATYTVDGTGAVVMQVFDANGNVVERIAYAKTIATSTAATRDALSSAVASIADASKDAHLRRIFDKADRLTYSADGVGGVTQRVYDKNGNLVQQTAYANAIGAAALPSSVTASVNDRSTVMRYDSANRQTLVTDAGGGVTEFSYDKNGNLTRRLAYAKPLTSTTVVADALNDRVTRFAFDAANRQVFVIDASGAITQSFYDAVGNTRQVLRYANQSLITGALSATATAADINAYLVGHASDTGNRLETRVYDAANRLVISADALGYATKTVYNGVGRITSTTQYATPIAVSSLYDPVAITNAVTAAAKALVDRSTSYAYDAAGHLASSTDALGGVETYSYDGLGQKRSYSNQAANLWSYNYDASGNLIQETSPQVALTSVIQGTDGALVVDAAKSVSASVITLMGYDALGNLRTRTEASGRPEQRLTEYRYDALGRQTMTVYPAVYVYTELASNLASNGASSLATRVETQQPQLLYTQTTYDALGNAVSNRDLAGNLSYKTYDKLGRVKYELDALGFVSGYTRNAYGEATELVRYANASTLVNSSPASLQSADVSAAVNAAGLDHGADRRLLTEYDRAGRVSKVTAPQAFAYDAETAASGNASEVASNSYNAFGDLVRVALLKNASANTWTATNNYLDQRGQKIASVDALGYLTTQVFDGVGNVVSRTEYATAVAGWNSLATPATAPSAVSNASVDRSTKSSFDRNNRKTSDTRVNVEYSTTGNGTSTRGDLVTAYAYDAVGNLTCTTDASGACTYSYYDALGRVRAVAEPTRAGLTTGSSLTPLTEFRRDAYGKVVVQIERSLGAASVSNTSYTPGAVALADRSSLSLYDSFGHLTQLTDALGYNHYSSYDARGNIAKEWQGVSDSAGNVTTLFRAYQYDKLGHQTHVIDPASSTVLQGGLSTVISSASLFFDESGYVSLSGSNSVALNWSTLTEPSGGLVRVQLDYQAYSNGPSGAVGHAASRTQDFAALGASSGVTLSWADASNVDGGISQISYIRVWQQAAGGNWVIKWQGSGAQASGSGVNTVTQALAGVVDTALEYNAFGELIRKGVNGGRQEYFNYDNAGHLWRTNSGDGIDKVALYDLQGHQTADIRSAGTVNLLAYAQADQVAALTSDVQRTEIQYDALGRVARQKLAQRLDSQGTVTVRNNAVSVSTAYWSDNNSVTCNSATLSWTTLATLGNGDIKVVMTYATRYPPPLTQTRIVTAEQAATGLTLSWQDRGSAGGIVRVTQLQVYKMDVQGKWQAVIDRTQWGLGPSTIEVATPAAELNPDITNTANAKGTLVELQIRVAGSSAWGTSKPMVNFGDALRFDASQLSAGNYEYQVLTTPSGEASRVTDTGTLNVGAAPLSAIAGMSSVSSVGICTWPTPGSTVTQALSYRPSGSTGAWSSLAVSNRASGYDGVDASALGAGSYDFELLWSRVGEGTPYAHATGKFTVVAATTSSQTITPTNPALYATGNPAIPYNPPVMTATLIGYDESGIPSYTLTLGAHYAYSGAKVVAVPYTVTTSTPKQYSLSVTTAPASAALSLAPGVGNQMTQGVGLNGDSRWVRPVIEQKTDRWGNVLEINDARTINWKTLYSYNANNQLIRQSQTDASGAQSASSPVTSIYFDKMGHQLAVKDAKNNINAQVFDAAGQLTGEVHADAGTAVYRYNIFGEKVQSVDARNYVTNYSYDKLSRLLSTVRPTVNVYSVNASNALVPVESRAITEINNWDEAGRKRYATNGNNETIRYSYDLRGNVVATQQPPGQIVPLVQKTVNAFDLQGRKIAEVDANGNVSTWSYDYFGLLIGHTDIGGAKYSYDYNNARQLTNQTNSRGLNQQYTYDAAGQLVQQRSFINTDAAGTAIWNTTRYAYDLAGHHVQEKTTQTTRLANGSYADVTYQDNHLGYDALGLLRWVGDERAFVNISYDSVGNRSNITTHVINGDISQDSKRFFQYDAMNRQTLVDGVDAAGTLYSALNPSQIGHFITYDKMGNRFSDRYAVAPVSGSTASTQSTEIYDHDGLNRLIKTTRDNLVVDQRYYDGANRVLQTGAAVKDGVTRINRFDSNGRLLFQKVLGSTNSAKYDINYSSYDAAGNLLAYTLQNYEGSAYTNSYSYTLNRLDSYKEGKIAGTSTLFQSGSTTDRYDANAELIGVTDSTQSANNRDLVNDAAGRALYVNQGGHVQRQLIVNGEVLGRYGELINASTPRDANGLPSFTNQAEFSFGYRPIDGNYPTAAPGVYVIAAGDTLASIARGAYGDSGLWYLIAEANGLSGNQDLRIGQTLSIPNRAMASSNKASTFKPYDPSKVQGDTTPNLPQPSSSGGGCGGLGLILMVVVAVVVSVITDGAATPYFESVFGAGTTSATVATAATAAAAGSVASQMFGMAIGVQKDFSWSAVGMSALSGGIGGGLSGGVNAGNTIGNTVVRAAVGNALAQGIGVVTGLQPSFSWTGVAAAAVGAGVGYGMNAALGLSSGAAYSGLEKIARASLSGLAAGTAAAVMRGGRFSVQQVATDAFGQALGNSLAEGSFSMQSQNSAQQSFRGSEIQAQNTANVQSNALPTNTAQESFRASEIQTQNSDAALLAAQDSMSAAQGSFRRGEIAYQNASNGSGFVDAPQFDDGASYVKQQGRQHWQAVYGSDWSASETALGTNVGGQGLSFADDVAARKAANDLLGLKTADSGNTLYSNAPDGLIRRDGKTYFLAGRDANGQGTYQLGNLDNGLYDQIPGASSEGEKRLLGSLSMKYETGKNPDQYGDAAGVVSNGRGDRGGISYGAYQLASSMVAGEQVQKFLRFEGSPWASTFDGLDPKQSGAFGQQWQAIAQASPEQFFAAQHGYIERTHYAPVVAYLSETTGIDISTQPAAVQDAVWSASVQHGGAKYFLTNAVNAADQQMGRASEDYSTVLINAIYDKRAEYVSARNIPETTKQSLLQNRYPDERQRALDMLDGHK